MIATMVDATMNRVCKINNVLPAALMIELFIVCVS